MKKKRPCPQTFSEILGEPEWTDFAFARGVYEAVMDHKRAGIPIAVREDGQVKIIPPEEIQWQGDMPNWNT